MITQTNDRVMNKAVFILKEMSADKKLQEVARIRERALHDEASYLADARAEGISIGEKKGRAEGRAEGISIGEKKGRAEGINIGRADGINAVLEAMRAAGLDTSQVEALNIS